MAKRIFDISLALALLPAALVVLLFAAPVAWWETGASPIFFQWRVGIDQRPFRIIKLRTMKADTRDLASHEVPQQQITKSGRWLRRLKFDELPQLLNVLAGEMSFVGPRPCLPTQTELIEARSNLAVFGLKPGITGPSQIEGIDMSTPVELAESDARYLEPWSLWRDLALIVATVAGRGNGDAARISS